MQYSRSGGVKHPAAFVNSSMQFLILFWFLTLAAAKTGHRFYRVQRNVSIELFQPFSKARRRFKGRREKAL